MGRAPGRARLQSRYNTRDARRHFPNRPRGVRDPAGVRRAGAGLSVPADQGHRSVHAGHRHGHDCAQRRTEALRAPGTAHRHREQARGEREHRRRDGRALRAGRAHGDDHGEHHADRGHPVPQRSLRPAHRLLAHLARRLGNPASHRQSQGEHQFGRRSDRAGEGEPGQAHLRLSGRGHAASHVDGAVQGPDRNEPVARALQGQRRRAHRPSLRGGQCRVRADSRRHAPRQGRQAQAARGGQRETPPERTGCSQPAGVGGKRRERGHVVRVHGAQGYARPGRRQARLRAARHPFASGNQIQLRETGPRRGVFLPRGAERPDAARLRALGGGHQEEQHHRRLARRFGSTGRGMARERILTTHAGALPRSPELREMIFARAEGRLYDKDALASKLRDEVAGVVRKQLDCGVDSVNDGELGKTNFTNYVRERLAGFEMRDYRPGVDPAPLDITARDAKDFPRYFAGGRGALTGAAQRRQLAVCVAPLKYVGQTALEEDFGNFRTALKGAKAAEAFLPANTPGTIEHWLRNEYYPSEEAFVGAIAEAMRSEYKAIVDAGFLLQIDDPDLPDGWQMYPDMSVREYRKYATLRVDAINQALRGIPREKVRLHVCWGSFHGPHRSDIPLEDIVDIIFRVRASSYSIEASNPVHEHEWRVFEDAKL